LDELSERPKTVVKSSLRRFSLNYVADRIQNIVFAKNLSDNLIPRNDEIPDENTDFLLN
jgi:hypothetical protein